MMKDYNGRTESIIEHFATRAEKYEEHLDWVNDEKILELMVGGLIEENDNLKILDLGAGTGAVSKYILQKSVKCKVVALDICQEMLNKIDDPRINTICSDAERLPFEDKSFDFVVSRQCLHYVKNLDQALSEVGRVLKPEGIFVLAQIVPCDQETSAAWTELTKMRQPLRNWFYTAEGWNLAIEGHSLTLRKFERYIKIASVNKLNSKYVNDNSVVQNYREKLLSMNYQYKERYAVREMGDDVFYHSFWYIAQYSKK